MSRRRALPALIGLVLLVVGIALLAAVVGAFAASRCGGGKASAGQLALRIDAAGDQERGRRLSERARGPSGSALDGSPFGLRSPRGAQVRPDVA
jgi:hypothetical protein